MKHLEKLSFNIYDKLHIHWAYCKLTRKQCKYCDVYKKIDVLLKPIETEIWNLSGENYL